MRAVSILSVLVALGVVAASQAPTTATASNAIAKQEGLACTSCHDKPGSKLLTDRGKYYELMSSLEGYDELHATFHECTACHVRKPGSLKLTRRGKQFRWMVDDMEGLRALLMTHHPALPPSEPEEGEQPSSAAPGNGSP